MQLAAPGRALPEARRARPHLAQERLSPRASDSGAAERIEPGPRAPEPGRSTGQFSQRRLRFYSDATLCKRYNACKVWHRFENSTSLAKLPPYPPQGRDFPLKPRHHLQNCWRNCPAAKWHGSTPPGRGGGAHHLRDERPANSSAGTDPHQGRDRTGAAPSGQATGHWGRQSAYPNARFPTPMWASLPQCDSRRPGGRPPRP